MFVYFVCTVPYLTFIQHLAVLALSLIQYYQAVIDILVRPAIISPSPPPSGRVI